MRRRRAIERAVDPIRVVVVLEFDKLACQVRSIPEEYPTKISTFAFTLPNGMRASVR